MNKPVKQIKVSESVTLSDSVAITSESIYLLESNKKRVIELLIKSELGEHDLIDLFIGLHLILEVGINIFFRQIVGPTLKKEVGRHIMLANLDSISFIDKVIMFMYYLDFELEDINTATKYHQVINKLRSFSEMRNKLLHGHAISSTIENGANNPSSLKKSLTLSHLQQQLDDFRFILDGVGYFFDRLRGGITPHGKEAYKKSYLSHAFLPKTSFSSE
jgi:hypothetical protein